jgi:hypothetical protein
MGTQGFDQTAGLTGGTSVVLGVTTALGVTVALGAVAIALAGLPQQQAIAVPPVFPATPAASPSPIGSPKPPLATPRKLPPVLPASTPTPAAPPKLARPVPIAQEKLDINGDGKTDTLTIQMIAGRRYLDQNDWCGNGDKSEGIFQTVVRIAPSKDAKGKRIPGKTVVQSLNRLYGEKARPEMFFRSGNWRIIFGDYTRTGAVTFNLGQFRSCQGAGYKVFRIQPNGQIVSLHPTGLGFWVADFANSSVQLKPNESGFCVPTFDAEIDTGKLPGVENRCYAWNRNRLGFQLVN